jgi:4-hydroxy-tetrahydrodipicolinate synthase
MKKDIQLEGIIPALVTPLNGDQSINDSALCALIEYVLAAGVHGLFALSNQGEFYAFSMAQKERVIATAVSQAAGRVPVWAGAAANTTGEAIAIAQRSAELGANGLCILTPYMVRLTQKEVFNHFRAIAEAVDLPIILYSNPLRTGLHINTTTVVKLAAIRNIIGIKDSSGNLAQTMEYIQECPRDFSVMIGNDNLICAALVMGAKGAIASSGNVIPQLLVDLYSAFRRGDINRAVDLQYRVLPLRQAFELGTFPVVIKEALNLIRISAGPAHSPVEPLSEEARAELRGILSNLGLLAFARKEEEVWK